jgi:hypothetical protein
MATHETAEAIHVFPRGEEHIADMDCHCEPTSWTSIENPFGGPPLRIIVHGSAIDVVVQIKEEQSSDDSEA